MRLQWLTAEGIFIEEIKIHSLYLIFDIVEILFIECLCWRLEWIRFDWIPIEKVETTFGVNSVFGGSEIDI